MKKITLTAISILAITLVLPAMTVLAQQDDYSKGNPLRRACEALTPSQRQQSTACNKEVENDENGNRTNPIYGPDGIIIKIANAVALVAGVIAVIAIIVSAIGMITSSGDSQRFTQARNGIIYSAVGIAIILVAQGLVRFIVNRL